MPRLLPVLLLVMAWPGAAPAAENAEAAQRLPAPLEWLVHLERDLMPFWTMPAALGTPIGNFPTFRCNDGSLYNPRRPCPELAGAEPWISDHLDRRYVRIMSRQVYAYAAAFHMTGKPRYLALARAGVRFILDEAVDPATGDVVTYWDGGGRPDNLGLRQTSQDLAYALNGLSFYYYVTRDPEVLDAIRRVKTYIFDAYFDRQRDIMRLTAAGERAGHRVLVANLDQINAYMLLVASALPQPERTAWIDDLRHLTRIIIRTFHDPATGMILNNLDTAEEPPNFGHTIKTYWMIHNIGRLARDPDLTGFAADQAERILDGAFLADSGAWARQPNPDGSLERNVEWWVHAERDQAAASLALDEPRLAGYLARTYRFWLEAMVDHRYGEVWDTLIMPGRRPAMPKAYSWKNGYHSVEHALIAYITTKALAGLPVTLYYAFPVGPMPQAVAPYVFNGAIVRRTVLPLDVLDGHNTVAVTFDDIR